MNTKIIHFFFLFFCVIIPFSAFKWNELTNFYSVYADISGHYFFYLFRDFYHLFPDDLYISYLKHGITSWVGGMLHVWFFNWFYGSYCLLSLFIHPLILLKIGVCIQFLLSCCLIYFTFHHKRVYRGLWILFFFQLISFTMDTYMGGLARGYGEVMLLLYIHSFIHKRYGLCWKITGCTLFIYPHIIPFMITNLVLFSGFKVTRALIVWGTVIIIFLFFYIAVFPIYQQDIFLNDSAKLAYSSYRCIHSEIFEGTFWGVLYDLYVNFFNFIDHPGYYAQMMIVCLFITIFVFLKYYPYFREGEYFKQLFCMAGGAVFVFFIICAAGWFLGTQIFYYHIAGKQVKNFIPIFISVLCGSGLYRVFREGKIIIYLYILFIIIIACQKRSYTLDLSSYKTVYAHIQALSIDSIILGNVKDMEFIPLYTQRQCYWMYIWSENSASESFHNEKERRLNLLKMIPLYSPDQLMEFFLKERITHLFIDSTQPLIPLKNIYYLINKKIIKPIYDESNYVLYEIIRPG